MLEPNTARLLIEYSNAIEICLSNKARFIASEGLQDKVFHYLQRLIEIGRYIEWGYHATRVEDAWFRINGLVLEQHLLSGTRGLDLYKVWKVTTRYLPVIKQEASFWLQENRI